MKLGKRILMTKKKKKMMMMMMKTHQTIIRVPTTQIAPKLLLFLVMTVNHLFDCFIKILFFLLMHFKSILESSTEQQAPPNLINYQGSLEEGNKITTHINPDGLNQDAFFEGEIEVITREAFLRNVSLANKHLCLVIDNPNLPAYIHTKVQGAIVMLRADEEKVNSGEALPLDSNIKIGNAALVLKRKRPKKQKGTNSKRIFVAEPDTVVGPKLPPM
ncbi:hypothetical protein PPACK8108_LOCUS2188, partial [Phakopsora pachyrhizi]